MPPTIRDVARRAGVSHTTVSNVLNDVPKVSAETRQKVRAAMEELGFEPNLVARSLNTKRSWAVGYMVPAITNEFFMSVARGVEQVLYREKISLFLCDTMLEVDRETDYLHRLIRHRVDGIIFNYAANEKSVLAALKAGIPVVAVESPVGIPGVSVVEADNAAAAMLGVEHLAALGHRHIAVLAIDFDSNVNKDRLRGFQNGLKLHDLPFRPELLLPLSTFGLEHGYFDPMVDLAKSPVTAHRQFAQTVEKLLTLPEPPTAVFCFDYYTAVLLIRCLVNLGRRPPEVSVIGFDSPASVCLPRMTSIVQPAMEMGALAANLLLERITNPNAPPRTLRVAAQLVPGETTGPVPRLR